MEEQSRVSKIYLSGTSARAVLADGVHAPSTPASTPCSTPQNFDQAVDWMLREGFGPREVVHAAAERWPALFRAWQDELKHPY